MGVIVSCFGQSLGRKTTVGRHVNIEDTTGVVDDDDSQGVGRSGAPAIGGVAPAGHVAVGVIVGWEVIPDVMLARGGMPDAVEGGTLGPAVYANVVEDPLTADEAPDADVDEDDALDPVVVVVVVEDEDEGALFCLLTRRRWRLPASTTPRMVKRTSRVLGRMSRVGANETKGTVVGKGERERKEKPPKLSARLG